MSATFIGRLWIIALCVGASLTTTGQSSISGLAKKTPIVNSGHSIRKPQIVESYGKLPLAFEANQGQVDKQVQFISRGGGYTLFLTSNEAVFSSSHTTVRTKEKLSNNHLDTEESVIRMKLVGAAPSPHVSGLNELPGRSNYILGNDPKNWRTDVLSYTKVKYEQVYPGIDLIYYGNQRQLEYDLVVSPGADPKIIEFELEGSDRVQIDGHGDLVFRDGDEKFRIQKPVIYQQADSKSEISGKYVLEDTGRIRFDIGEYDATKPLVIDPVVLTYSTYLGGFAEEYGSDIAVDGFGNAYVVGSTWSSNFPTRNALQSVKKASDDIFVTKLNAAGNGFVFSTFIGGSGRDAGTGVALDSFGNVYIVGITSSSDFPVANPVQSSYAGPLPANGENFGDTAVVKLDSTGHPVYSTYLGGSGYDRATGIAVDGSGNAYITGGTSSSNFPVVNALTATVTPINSVGFLTEISSSGSSFLYSTYIGNSEGEGDSIAVDPSGMVYVSGNSQVAGFPTTTGVYKTTVNYSGSFATKFDTTQSGAASLIYATFLIEQSHGNGIAVDSSGNAYVSVSNFSDTQILKLNSAGTDLIYNKPINRLISNTSIGSGDIASSIAIDSLGNAYVAGNTNTPDFPLVNAFEGYTGNDAFIMKLDPTGSTWIYSTRIGGSHAAIDLPYNAANGIAVDSNGNAYVAGYAGTTDFFLKNPLQATYGGGFYDAFVAKLGTVVPDAAPSLATISPSSVQYGSAGFTITLTGSDFAATSVVRWNGAPRTTTFVNLNKLTATIFDSDVASAGFVPVTVVTPSPGGGTSNSLNFTVIGNPPPTITFLSPTSTLAGSGGLFLTVVGTNFVAANGGSPSSTVQWNGVNHTTTYVSSTQLLVFVSGSDVALPGVAQVAVVNPAPGGGVSSSAPFAILKKRNGQLTSE